MLMSHIRSSLLPEIQHCDAIPLMLWERINYQTNQLKQNMLGELQLFHQPPKNPEKKNRPHVGKDYLFQSFLWESKGQG